MAKFEVTSADFSISFSRARWGEVWDEADRNIGAVNLTSIYAVEGAEATFRFTADQASASVPVVTGGQAFFFDNVSYDVWLEFDSHCSEFAVTDVSRAVEDAYTKHGHVLTARLDFKNDIGRADLNFRYQRDGVTRTVTFSFEVLSSKLDYHKDWQLVFNDVERKYPMLAADYLRRTYHAFDREPKTDAPTPDLIWWNLFKEEQEPFIKACELVVSRPRKRLHPLTEYRRADQLRLATPVLEEQVMEHRGNPAHLYATSREDLSHDTVENRFVKYALRFVSRNYERLIARIEKEYGERLSDNERSEMCALAGKLRRLNNHPFFRDVGRFTGLRQESSILQRAPGYSTVWRSFAILNASYMLYKGARRLQTKNIADLYEIWCFLKVEEIVRACCVNCDVVENYRMLDEKFVQQLDEGEGSSVIFKDPATGVELAKLVYNLNIPFKGISRHEHVFTPTSLTDDAKQKPDIILRLTKTLNGNAGFKMTYLFDAKYRIENQLNHVDYPPQDALNQMHRYRDAIYFGDSSNPALAEQLKKEVIGGYVLFPGAGQIPPKPAAGQPDHRPRFIKSVDRVNIGAFPLRPGNQANISALTLFVRELINKNPRQEVTETIPQKGTVQVLVDAFGADAFVRAPTKTGTLDASRAGQHGGRHYYPVLATSVRRPEQVRWIILPRSSNPVPLLSVKTVGQFDKKDISDLLTDYPEFANVGLPPGDYYLWEVQET